MASTRSNSVTLDQPLLMVENEIYFPGWTAELISKNETTTIEAVSVNDLYRAWLLPAGNYKMLAQFKFPSARVYNGLSIVALAIWIFLLARFGILSTTKNKK